MSTDNFSDCVLAKTKISGNPSVAATCFNRLDGFWVKFVGFLPHAYNFNHSRHVQMWQICGKNDFQD